MKKASVKASWVGTITVNNTKRNLKNILMKKMKQKKDNTGKAKHMFPTPQVHHLLTCSSPSAV